MKCFAAARSLRDWRRAFRRPPPGMRRDGAVLRGPRLPAVKLRQRPPRCSAPPAAAPNLRSRPLPTGGKPDFFPPGSSSQDIAKSAPRGGENHSHSCYTPDFFSSFDIDEALFPAYWRYHAMFPRPLPHAANAPPPAALRFMLHLRQTPMRQDGSCSAGCPPRRQPAGRACRFFGPGRGGGMHSESPGRAHHGR